MVPLILDNKKKVSNVVWIEDIWEAHVEALFPDKLKNIILRAHNKFHPIINELNSKEKVTHSFHYCATDRKTEINTIKGKSLHIALSQNPLQAWNKITQAYLNLIHLKNKESLTKLTIHCRPLTVSEGHVMSNMSRTSAGLVDACTLFYHLGVQGPQIKIIKTCTSQKSLIESIISFLQMECGKDPMLTEVRP